MQTPQLPNPTPPPRVLVAKQSNQQNICCICCRTAENRRPQLTEDCRTQETTLQSKLYGTRARDDLQRTAKFIAATGLSVYSSKANKKESKSRPTKNPVAGLRIVTMN